MPQFSICRRFLLVVAALSFAAPTCWASDPLSTAQPAADDELAILLKKIRAAHDAVFSGEFLAAEVIEQPTFKHEKFRKVYAFRGAFDREHGHTRRRHEFLKPPEGRPQFGPFFVVETDASKALWANSGSITLLPSAHKLLLEQSPIDPFALGFLPTESQRRTSFAEWESLISAHNAKGHVSVRREQKGYVLSNEVPAAPAGAKNPGPRMTVKVVWRTRLEPGFLGFVPRGTTISFLNKDGKDVRHPSTIDVTWAKRGEVAVPVIVRTYEDLMGGDEELRTITFTWKSVNQPISNDEFNYTKFPAPAETVIIDRRHLPAHEIGTIGK